MALCPTALFNFNEEDNHIAELCANADVPQLFLIWQRPAAYLSMCRHFHAYAKKSQNPIMFDVRTGAAYPRMYGKSAHSLDN